jgi:hypothetical protein
VGEKCQHTKQLNRKKMTIEDLVLADFKEYSHDPNGHKINIRYFITVVAGRSFANFH